MKTLKILSPNEYLSLPLTDRARYFQGVVENEGYTIVQFGKKYYFIHINSTENRRVAVFENTFNEGSHLPRLKFSVTTQNIHGMLNLFNVTNTYKPHTKVLIDLLDGLIMLLPELGFVYKRIIMSGNTVNMGRLHMSSELYLVKSKLNWMTLGSHRNPNSSQDIFTATLESS